MKKRLDPQSSNAHGSDFLTRVDDISIDSHEYCWGLVFIAVPQFVVKVNTIDELTTAAQIG